MRRVAIRRLGAQRHPTQPPPAPQARCCDTHAPPRLDSAYVTAASVGFQLTWTRPHALVVVRLMTRGATRAGDLQVLGAGVRVGMGLSATLTALTILDYFGTMVFACGGSLIAGENDMDLMGSLLLGTCSGIGGGTLRDVLLGTQRLAHYCTVGVTVSSPDSSPWNVRRAKSNTQTLACPHIRPYRHRPVRRCQRARPGERQ